MAINKITQKRQDIGLSMGALAVKAGLTRRQVEHIELGHAKHINLESLSRIANVLNCKVIELLDENTVARIGTTVVVFLLTVFIGG